jgi:hypothetical protein
MGKNSVLIFSFLILLSCNNSKNERKNIGTSLFDTAAKKTQKKVEIRKKIDGDTLIYGRWCGIVDTTSSFQIDSHGIFYYDAIRLYKYALFDKMLKIKFDDYTSISRIKFNGNDTLIMIGTGKGEGVNDTLYRCYK